MYIARIVFVLEKDGDLDIGDKVLFEKCGRVCKIKIDRDVDPKKVIVTYSGFSEFNDAETAGKRLFYDIKTKFIKLGIPISITGGNGFLDSDNYSTSTGGLTEFGKRNIGVIFPDIEGCQIENEVMGLQVYKVDNDLSKISFFCTRVKAEVKRQMPEISDEQNPCEQL